MTENAGNPLFFLFENFQHLPPINEVCRFVETICDRQARAMPVNLSEFYAIICETLEDLKKQDIPITSWDEAFTEKDVLNMLYELNHLNLFMARNGIRVIQRTVLKTSGLVIHHMKPPSQV